MGQSHSARPRRSRPKGRPAVTSQNHRGNPFSSALLHSTFRITTRNRAMPSQQVHTALFTEGKVSSSSQQNIRPGDEEHLFEDLSDLDQVSPSSSKEELAEVIDKYTVQLASAIRMLRSRSDKNKKLMSSEARKLHLQTLHRTNNMIRKAWLVTNQKHELGHRLCSALLSSGGLDLIISLCAVDVVDVVDSDRELQYSGARLLEQCLTEENRKYVAHHGLEEVVRVACTCAKNNDNGQARVGTSILEQMFKLSPDMCSAVIQLGGLGAVLYACRKDDAQTLTHCAGALANLVMFGGADNQQAMIQGNGLIWLFPLAFHKNDIIQYYACLATVVLVANTEVEAAVLKCRLLNLVEPFIKEHDPPAQFARKTPAMEHGRSAPWLKQLVPVLSSKREEARNLAAFHFCMEAGIKKQQGNTAVFREIGAIEPLKKCASCPNAVASKYAAQALQIVDEKVPHKLSQHVLLWSTEDVLEWIGQIDFEKYASRFVASRVDGDLLLLMTEENLRTDIGICNGLERKRFTRELNDLRMKTDYSSKDSSDLSGLLSSMDPEFTVYTLGLLTAGVDRDSICDISADELSECGVLNSLHRQKILDCIKNFSSGNKNKLLDAFISYRRSNGSPLASLVKANLETRNKDIRVFMDVRNLGAGKFDENLIEAIKRTSNFILILSPNALDRCLSDTEGKDWVHKEIVTALQSNKNIIPILDKDFSWPRKEELPEDIQALVSYNAVNWVHDYGDASMKKLESFMGL